MPKREYARDEGAYVVTQAMERFVEEIAALGGTVRFEKVRLEGTFVPSVTVEMRGEESKTLLRPTFRQACDELAEWVMSDGY